MKRPLVLIVRDGWGSNPFPQWDKANAVKLAKHPVDDKLMAADLKGRRELGAALDSVGGWRRDLATRRLFETIAKQGQASLQERARMALQVLSEPVRFANSPTSLDPPALVGLFTLVAQLGLPDDALIACLKHRLAEIREQALIAAETRLAKSTNRRADDR